MSICLKRSLPVDLGKTTTLSEHLADGAVELQVKSDILGWTETRWASLTNGSGHIL